MARTSKRTPAAGPSKVNIAGELEIDVTLKAWQLYTGKNAKQLKNWVIDTVLPSIPVFLEWSRGVKAANVNRQKKKRMGQLTRTAVVEAMLDDLSPVQMPSEDFVQSGGLNVVSVWAHTAHIVRDHLEAIPECGKTFKDDNQWACAAFDFLKFIVKNSAEGRPFQSGKITAADNKRIAFVLGEHSSRAIVYQTLTYNQRRGGICQIGSRGHSQSPRRRYHQPRPAHQSHHRERGVDRTLLASKTSQISPRPLSEQNGVPRTSILFPCRIPVRQIAVWILSRTGPPPSLR